MNTSFNVLQKYTYNSFIDKVNPISKIICLLLFSLVVFLSHSLTAIFLIFCLVILLGLFAKMPLKAYYRSFLFTLPIFLLTLFINIWIIDESSGATNELFNIGNQVIYLESITVTLTIALKIYLLIFMSYLLILSSSETELSNAISILINPLKYIKVPVNEISLIITIGLRYLPLLIYETKLIVLAQATRGMDYQTSGLITKFKVIINIFNPLLVNSFLKADDLTEAMMIRNYQVGEKRTRYETYKFTFYDYAFLTYFVLLLSFAIFLVIDNGNLIPLFLDPK